MYEQSKCCCGRTPTTVPVATTSAIVSTYFLVCSLKHVGAKTASTFSICCAAIFTSSAYCCLGMCHDIYIFQIFVNTAQNIWLMLETKKNKTKSNTVKLHANATYLGVVTWFVNSKQKKRSLSFCLLSFIKLQVLCEILETHVYSVICFF